MAVPTHRPDCETMIWRTRCPDCGDPVYFFSCSCGSKVYFDLNHWPWNPHADRCIPYLVRTLRDVHGYNPAQILRTVDERARQLGEPIPPEIEQQLLNMVHRARPGLIVHKVLPGEPGTIFVGRVHHIDQEINFFKRYGMVENPISRQLLGQITTESYSEVTVRTDPEPGTHDCHEITLIYPRRLLAQIHVSLRSLVWVVVNPYKIAGQDNPIWLAETVDPM